MKIEIELPDPAGEYVEEQLTAQFTHLVTICRSMLNTYKKDGIEVPTLSIKIPSKLKKPAKVGEGKEFVAELLKYHLDRVPTANVPAQRNCLKVMYEQGHTDVSLLKSLYQESLKTFAGTSWTTVRWKLNHISTETKEPANDMEFQRKELDEEHTESLIARLKANALDTDDQKVV